LIVFDLFCFLEMSIPLSIHVVARYLGIRLFLVGYRDYIICFFPYFLAISTAQKSNSNGFVMIPSLRQVEILYHCASHSTSCAVRSCHLFQVYRPKLVRILWDGHLASKVEIDTSPQHISGNLPNVFGTFFPGMKYPDSKPMGFCHSRVSASRKSRGVLPVIL